MKKILSPIINLISLILVGVAFGLGGLSAAHIASASHTSTEGNMGTYYQLVWSVEHKSVLAIVGFFLLCVGAFLLLVVFLPKIRKFVAPLAGGMLIAAGVIALLMPARIQPTLTVENQPGLIAMAVLLFVAGGFSLIVCALEFLSKE